uniref:Skp1-related protein n=1 Tax=Angiostrongylus cantonensis TaxID=6313 RepID=A0A0K0DLJ7_ANGCA
MVSPSNSTNASTEKRTSEKVYKLQTKDNEIFEVSASIIGMSKLISTMSEDLNLQDDDTPVPIPNVSANIFKKIVLWCEKHMYVGDDPAGPQNVLEQWDNDFFNVDHPTLFELIMGKTTEEIREMFNIVNDFTPEEEEQIRKENAWCEE